MLMFPKFLLPSLFNASLHECTGLENIDGREQRFQVTDGIIQITLMWDTHTNLVLCDKLSQRTKSAFEKHYGGIHAHQMEVPFRVLGFIPQTLLDILQIVSGRIMAD